MTTEYKVLRLLVLGLLYIVKPTTDTSIKHKKERSDILPCARTLHA